MEPLISEIHQLLQEMIGLQRRLLETVRLEKEILIEADIVKIEATAESKQKLLEQIHHAEKKRIKLISELAALKGRPATELSLSKLILEVQEHDRKKAEQFRTAFNTLKLLVQRIYEQNHENQLLLEHSLEHIHQMKMNILNAVSPKAGTYTPKGQQSPSSQVSRILTREA